MRPRVFNIAPGAPFLETFVAALYEGRVIPEFSHLSDPLDLAKIRIYVPTRRAAGILASVLARLNRRSAALLPQILPLGALDDDDSDFALDDTFDLSLPQAVSELERRMSLGELILEWSARVKQAIVTIDSDGGIRHASESLLVGTHPVDAWRLAGELAHLIDEMIIEDVAWKNLGELNSDFDEYWRLTLHFLNIAIEAWPKILQERCLVDPATRQKATLTHALDTVIQAESPLIALGSTGSNVVTAQLLAAIARAKHGAVVLPGLDMHLDAASFAVLQDAAVANPTHPQAFLARLIKTIGVEREDIAALGAPNAKLARREQFVSESFRPADTTDQWRNWRSLYDPTYIRSALEDVALIEAANEREEALAIAICLREALEDKARIAALVTPDRALAKRVSAELLRWNIEINDSAGISLGLTSAGTVARLLLKALSGESKDWASLLAHPLVTLGLGSQAERLSRLFELCVLRGGSQSACWRQTVASARERAQERDAHPRQKSIAGADWAALEDYAGRLDAAIDPLRAVADGSGLDRWLQAHHAAIGLACYGEASLSAIGEDGEALALLFDELAQTASIRYAFDLEAYAVFFDALVTERAVRGAESGHPRLHILGLLEARLIGATRLILAGLDETVWPPQAANDLLLNRPMREALGLSSPDRRIGQTAHDFCQSLGAPEVILTRAKKRGGVPTIPSRFLQRMEALAGAEIFDDLRCRGNNWLELARRLDQSEPIAALRRPDPKPPVGLRPKSLSVTRIETLRRDPYSIYARHILKLQPMPLLDEKTGPREIGIEMHAVLESFGRSHPSGPLPEDARSIILDLVRRHLRDFVADPEFLAFRWSRLEKGIDVYLGFEAERRPKLERLFVEESGALAIPLADGSEFLLTCKADRIEILAGGEIALGDYKTGEVPTFPQIAAGFAPQLTLEAAMVERGAFKTIPARPVTAAFYIPLGGAKDAAFEIKPGPRSKETGSFRDLAQEHFSELADLLNDFRDPSRGYPARPFPQFASRFNDYDHLARTREWSVVGASDSAEDA